MANTVDLSELASERWDAIVIGTGMGGATAGHALAQAGWRVLFLERGASHLGAADTALTGRYAEQFFAQSVAPQPEHRDLLRKAGRYADLIDDHSHSSPRSFVPFVGTGTGGSTALYGMALERFFPADFEPRRYHPGARETTLPEAWPIAYADLVPYYEAAERLYRVRGAVDPFRSGERRDHFMAPPALTPLGNEMFTHLAARGMHPYRLPMACEFVAGCECCQGYLCPKSCKNDATRICLEPALATMGAKLVDDCEVVRLEATRQEVTGVVCTWQGREVVLRSNIVILAAGALETPRLLLDSASAEWPQGLANESGLVGRNLMRHHIDLLVLPPKSKGLLDNRHKELAFNDFYQSAEGKFGSVQSFGRLPPAETLVAAMQDDLRQEVGNWAAQVFKLAKSFMKPFLGRMVGRSIVLATTLEDLPYADNRVEQSQGRARLAIRYRVRSHDRSRIEAFRRLVLAALKPYRPMLIKQAENNQRIAHVCGTCRFGDDPVTSVLDANNRAHGLDNLFVLDASFFPSSGGINPSLTIAANALRVADHLTFGSSHKPREINE